MPWDDHRPQITWRGDGQFFAVSVVCPETGMDISCNLKFILMFLRSGNVSFLALSVCFSSTDEVTVCFFCFCFFLRYEMNVELRFEEIFEALWSCLLPVEFIYKIS